jgi:hypothetical protein
LVFSDIEIRDREDGRKWDRRKCESSVDADVSPR